MTDAMCTAELHQQAKIERRRDVDRNTQIVAARLPSFVCCPKRLPINASVHACVLFIHLGQQDRDRCWNLHACIRTRACIKRSRLTTTVYNWILHIHHITSKTHRGRHRERERARAAHTDNGLHLHKPVLRRAVRAVRQDSACHWWHEGHRSCDR